MLDPELLTNIHCGAELLEEIMSHNGSILLVVDCDMDGYTSAAIMYQYIMDVNGAVTIDYILHDGKQHGLSDHIKYLMNNDKHYDLVILPDSSSNDYVYHE